MQSPNLQNLNRRLALLFSYFNQRNCCKYLFVGKFVKWLTQSISNGAAKEREHFGVFGTMPAKSLGTLAMIYAIVELQNPLPRKTMLWKADMNVSASTSDTFLQS